MDKTGSIDYVDHFFLIYVLTLYSVALIDLTYLSLFYFGQSLRIESAHYLISAMEVRLKISVEHHMG